VASIILGVIESDRAAGSNVTHDGYTIAALYSPERLIATSAAIFHQVKLP